MADLSDYAENLILDWIFNGTSLTAITPWVSLHTADPGETGTSEVTGGSYGRQDGSAAFAAASAGQVASNANILFTSMPAVTVTHVGIYDSQTTGGSNNFICKAALTASQAVGAGNTFQITSGDYTFDLA